MRQKIISGSPNVFALIVALLATGCGGSLPVHAGPISIVSVGHTSSVQLKTIAVGQPAMLTMSPSGDTSGAGVDWTVTCGGSPANGSITGGACGTLTPAHTSDGGATIYIAPALVPYLTNVTITASVTSSPAANSTLALPIVALPIAVNLTTPPPASLSAGQTTELAATVLNDTTNGGVTWSATCGSTDCGSFSSTSTLNPSYTAPATVPTGGAVVLTATSVADPTKSASATVLIASATQLTLTITSTLPAALVETEAASLTAVVANDSASSGVDWTAVCGTAGACGTFNLSPAHTASGGKIVYTAPAAIPSGDTVTITATATASTTASSSQTATVVAGPAAVVLTQVPPATVTAATKVPLKATVTNDITPGGVTWSVQCSVDLKANPGECGYVTPVQTANGATASYVAPPAPPAPPAGAVQIVATSSAFPTVSASSAPVTITPYTALSVNFIPFAPAQVAPASTVNLIAAVTNDTSNAGVDWQICASGCGFFTTRQAIAEIPATPTTPLVPAVPAVTSTLVQSWPNGLPIPYTAPNSIPQSGEVAISAAAHANTGVIVASNIVVTQTAGGPSLNGFVQAGTRPVVGAQVALYAAGVSGYGSPAVQLAVPGGASSATTLADGSFTLPAGYVCPLGGLVYLVATGGKVGGGATNSNLSMMTALGACANLGSAPVVINEVTTIASVWPLAQFSTNQPLSGQSGYLNLGTSSTNAVGLGRAFAMVNNLVDVTTGQSRYNVPTGNAVVPYVEINTLADALDACTATGGGQYGDGSACGTLFAATAPLYSPGNVYNSLAPTDTLQAAFNAAQHPAAGVPAYLIDVSSIYGLVASTSPFQPALTAVPSDLGISLHYIGTGDLTSSSKASSLAIDSADNVWVASLAGNQVIELNSTGAVLSPPGGYTVGGVKAPAAIAIDTSNNVWLANADSLSGLTNAGLPVQGSPFYGVTSGLNMAIDGRNNIWITNPGGVTEFNSLGTELSPVGGYVNDGVDLISQITIDGSNNIWLGYDDPTGGFRLAELSDSNGQLIVSASINGSQPQTPLVADNTGDIWSTPASILYKLPPYTGILAADYVPSSYLGYAPEAPGGLVTVDNAYGIALDGAGTLWIANAGVAGGATGLLSGEANLTQIVPGIVGNGYYGGLASPSLAVGPVQVALDGAGNAWVLLSDSSLTEFVGVAVPSTTPLAAAIANKRVGKTP